MPSSLVKKCTCGSSITFIQLKFIQENMWTPLEWLIFYVSMIMPVYEIYTSFLLYTLAFKVRRIKYNWYMQEFLLFIFNNLTLPALYFHTHSSTVICLSLTLFRIICFFHTSSGSFNASFWCRIICLLWFLISSQTQTLSLSVSSFRWARSRKQILCQRLPATKCLHATY